MYPILDISIWYSTVLFFMKFGNTCAFASVFYGTNALFREDLVAVIFALCNLFGRFFTIFAPFVAGASSKTVMTVYLSLSLFSLLCTVFITDPTVGNGRRSSRRRSK